MVEKYRYYERQYLITKTITDMAWTTLDFGSMACRDRGIYNESHTTGWREILPWRESVYLKNQGIGNDNTTDCQIEVYFNAYVINKSISIGTTQALVAGTPHGLAYNPTTELFTVNLGGHITPVTGVNPNNMYLEMKPFGPQDGNISDHSYLNAVCTDVTFVAPNVYTFDIAPTLVPPQAGAAQIKQMLINNLLLPYQNNASFHPPTFYQYTTNDPGQNRGIILNVGESYSGDLTYDVCVWWRGVASTDIDATLVIQQLA